MTDFCVDDIHFPSQYAYGENVGWLNAERLGDGGPPTGALAFRVTTAWSGGNREPGLKTVYVEYMDAAQNVSTPYDASIIYTGTPAMPWLQLLLLDD